MQRLLTNRVCQYGFQRRFYGGHAEEPIPHIPRYRKPVIPPGRPLAFILSGIMIVGSFGLSTGFFLTSEPSTDNWAGLSNQYKTENEKDPGHEAYRQKYLEKWKF